VPEKDLGDDLTGRTGENIDLPGSLID